MVWRCLVNRVNNIVKNNHKVFSIMPLWTLQTNTWAFSPSYATVPFRPYIIGWGAVAICSRIRRDDNIVYSSSLLAKGFFPETHIQMMSIIRIKIRIAVMNAAPFSPKTSMERKKSIGCIIARRSKNGVLSVLSPIGQYNLFSNINDWAALPLLMRKFITLPMWYNVIMGSLWKGGLQTH